MLKSEIRNRYVVLYSFLGYVLPKYVALTFSTFAQTSSLLDQLGILPISIKIFHEINAKTQV